MSIKYINGDLLETDAEYICHQVNCQGKMGSGLAKTIKEKWPKVYSEYIRWYNESLPMLGKIQIVPVEDKKIINMAGQDFYGYDGKRYTSYDTFWNCLGEIRNQVPTGSTIAFPYNIGCGLGGAKWELIETMIKHTLVEDYRVYIYKWEG